MTQVDLLRHSSLCDERHAGEADAEATLISRATATITGFLVLVAGVCAFAGLLQISGLALFAALVASIASGVGRPTRGARWIGPAIVGAAMLTVIVAGFLHH